MSDYVIVNNNGKYHGQIYFAPSNSNHANYIVLGWWKVYDFIHMSRFMLCHLSVKYFTHDSTTNATNKKKSKTKQNKTKKQKKRNNSMNI